MTTVTAAVLLLAVTAGRENINPGRCNVDVTPDKTLWRAELKSSSDIALEKKEGAEGVVK